MFFYNSNLRNKEVTPNTTKLNKTKFYLIGLIICVLVALVSAQFFIVDYSYLRCEQPGYDEEYSAYCYYSLAKENDNPSLCDTIPEEFKVLDSELPFGGNLLKIRNQCYRHFATKRNDLSFCNQILGFEKQICILHLTEDLSICEQIIEIEERDICYGSILTATENNSKKLEGCEKIEGVGYIRDICYLLVSNSIDDIPEATEICSNIENATRKNSCYLILTNRANTSMAVEICNKIEGETKDICLQWVFGVASSKDLPIDVI